LRIARGKRRSQEMMFQGDGFLTAELKCIGLKERRTM
jgi:hypothetical protein